MKNEDRSVAPRVKKRWRSKVRLTDHLKPTRSHSPLFRGSCLILGCIGTLHSIFSFTSSVFGSCVTFVKVRIDQPTLRRSLTCVFVFSRPPALGIELRSGGWLPERAASVGGVVIFSAERSSIEFFEEDRSSALSCFLLRDSLPLGRSCLRKRRIQSTVLKSSVSLFVPACDCITILERAVGAETPRDPPSLESPRPPVCGFQQWIPELSQFWCTQFVVSVCLFFSFVNRWGRCKSCSLVVSPESSLFEAGGIPTTAQARSLRAKATLILLKSTGRHFLQSHYSSKTIFVMSTQ